MMDRQRVRFVGLGMWNIEQVTEDWNEDVMFDLWTMNW